MKYLNHLNLKKPRIFCLFSGLIIILSSTLVAFSNASPIMKVIEEKENFENVKNNYFLDENLGRFPFIKSTDFWDILKLILKQIVEIADFLYKVIEPLTIIIFTVLFTLNPNLALLFVTLVVLLRFLSMIEIDTETLLSLLNEKNFQNILD